MCGLAVRVLGPRELNRALLARQLLLQRQAIGVRDALAHLVGMQAQAPYAPYVGLWSRIASFRPEALGTLLLKHDAVRASLMRVTLHLVTADDWLALRPVVEPVFRRQFGSSPWARNLRGLDIEEMVAAARGLLAQPVTRAALAKQLATTWPGYDPLSLAYAVTYLTPAVQAPPRGVWGERGAAVWTDAETWIGSRISEPGDPAAILRRYLAAYGPASVQDFTAWSGLSDADRLIEPLRPHLLTYHDHRGRELLDLAGAPLPDPDTPAPPRFLPEFDNVLFAHRDRSRIIEGKRNPPGFPGDGARAGPLLIDGFMRATWRVQRAANRADLVITPDLPVPSAHAAAVLEEGGHLLELLAPAASRREVTLTPPP